MKVKLIFIMLIALSGCDQAPLSVRTFANGNFENGVVVAEMEYLLREGKYCSYILVGDREKDSKASIDKYQGKISLKYQVEIPDMELVEEIDLGEFRQKDYGFLYEGGFSSHQFTLNVDNISSYRANVKTTLTVHGEKELLESGEFGIHFSEWQCK